jgi:hypothetical protein
VVEGRWLTAEQFVEIVREPSDGQVADWVLKNVRKVKPKKGPCRSADELPASPHDEAMQAREDAENKPVSPM